MPKTFGELYLFISYFVLSWVNLAVAVFIFSISLFTALRNGSDEETVTLAIVFGLLILADAYSNIEKTIDGIMNSLYTNIFVFVVSLVWCLIAIMVLAGLYQNHPQSSVYYFLLIMQILILARNIPLLVFHAQMFSANNRAEMRSALTRLKSKIKK